jgi:hypothetical protein
MLSYASFGTASNVAFKSLMYFSTKEVKSQTNKYKITNIYNPLQHRRTRRELRRFHFEKNFNIDYQVGVNQNNRINISIYDPENNYLLDLDKQEVINKTLVLETKKGFWGIEKVEKIVVE